MRHIIRNVRIYDRSPECLWDLVIEHERIASITPAGLTSIAKDSMSLVSDYAGTNSEVWPAFVESHAHLALSPYLEGPPDPPWVIAYQYLLSGVTRVADLFGFPEIADRWTQDIAQLNGFYPSVAHCGYALTSRSKNGRSGHGKEFPLPVFEVESPSEVDQAIQKNLSLGASFIKVMLTSGRETHSSKPRFSLLKRETLAYIARRLKTLGLPGVVDANSFEETRHAVEVGFRLFAHPVRSKRLTPSDWVTLKGCSFGSTLTGLRPMTQSWTDFRPTFEKASFLAYQSPLHLEFMRQRVTSYGTMIGIQKDRERSLENACVNTLEGIHRGQVALGTDSGNTFSFHGYGIGEEVRLLQGRGANLREMLTATARSGQRYFCRLSGAEEIAVHEGSRADLNVLDLKGMATGALTPVQTFVSGKEVPRKALFRSLRIYFDQTQKGELHVDQAISA